MPLDFFGPLGIGHQRFVPFFYPDDGGGGSGGDPAGDQNDGGDDGAKPDDAADDNDGSEADEPLGDEGKQALTSERKRSRDLAKQLRDANKRLQAIDDAKKDDLTKATEGREASDAKATRVIEKARDIAGRNVVESAAEEAGAFAPDAIYDLIAGKLEYEAGDDDEADDIVLTPSNAKAAIAAAKKRYPSLFAKGGSDAGQNGRGSRTGTLSANEQLRKQLRGE